MKVKNKTMIQTMGQGERCLVFENTAELFEAHRASQETLKEDHPVTKSLLGLLKAVVIEGCPFEAVAGIDSWSSSAVLGVLENYPPEDSWRGDQRALMLAGIEEQRALTVAA